VKLRRTAQRISLGQKTITADSVVVLSAAKPRFINFSQKNLSINQGLTLKSTFLGYLSEAR
jgi:hypothetical protein